MSKRRDARRAAKLSAKVLSSHIDSEGLDELADVVTQAAAERRGDIAVLGARNSTEDDLRRRIDYLEHILGDHGISYPEATPFTSRLTFYKDDEGEHRWRLQALRQWKVIDAASQGFNRLAESKLNTTRVRRGWVNPEIVFDPESYPELAVVEAEPGV